MIIAYYTDQVYLHGGIEKILSQKLNFLSNLTGYQIHLITIEQENNDSCYPISKKVYHHDLEINYVRTKSYFHPVNFCKVPFHIRKLKKTLQTIKPDVLIVCNFSFDFYFIPFIANNIKIIKEYHASRYYYIKNLPKASFIKKIFYKVNNFIENQYSYIALLNEDEKKYYKSENLVVIPNFTSKQNTKNTSKKENIILAAGRIAPVKQFDHLIKAWALIEKKFPEWEVHIYGHGDENLLIKLKNLISSLTLTRIKIKGATDILYSKLEKASLYAMTSSTECFPMVLLEALNNGLPIVSYKCPHGPSNIITESNDGVLVKHNNIEEFALELSKLIEDEFLRNNMSKNGIKNVSRFNEEIVMEQWLDLFKRKDK
jgi:glycosyltransferase involved in cell wall biosynthesis